MSYGTIIEDNLYTGFVDEQALGQIYNLPADDEDRELVTSYLNITEQNSDNKNDEMSTARKKFNKSVKNYRKNLALKLENMVLTKNMFDNCNKLGSGNFGDVYRIKMDQRTKYKKFFRSKIDEEHLVIVACKQIRGTPNPVDPVWQEKEQEFMAEATILAYLSRPESSDSTTSRIPVQNLFGIYIPETFENEKMKKKFAKEKMYEKNLLLDKDEKQKLKEFLKSDYFTGFFEDKVLSFFLSPLMFTELFKIDLEEALQRKVTLNSKVKSEKYFSLCQMVKWCLDISEALKYLEEKKVIHRDVATRNLMLDFEERAILIDFGLARMANKAGKTGHTEFTDLQKFKDFEDYDPDMSQVYTIQSQGKQLPVPYLSPECLIEQTFSHKSDIWAAGLAFLSIFTYAQFIPWEREEVGYYNRNQIWPEHQKSYRKTEFDSGADVIRNLYLSAKNSNKNPGQFLTPPKSINEKFWELIVDACFVYDQEKRWDAEKLVKLLRGVLKNNSKDHDFRNSKSMDMGKNNLVEYPSNNQQNHTLKRTRKKDACILM